MKRYLFLAIAVAMLLSLMISCGGKSSETSAEKETSGVDSTTQTTDTMPKDSATTTANKVDTTPPVAPDSTANIPTTSKGTFVSTDTPGETTPITTNKQLPSVSSSSAPATTPISTPVTTPTTTPAITTAAVTTLDTLSPSKRAELEAILTGDIEKSLVIANATIDAYGSYKVPMFGYILSRYCNPNNVKQTSETASVWHYTAYYAMVSRLLDISQGTDAYDGYLTLSDNVYKGFEHYLGTADVTTYLGTSSVTFYGVNRSNLKGKANVAGDQAVYDDQMWIIREMVYRYKQTKDRQYLDEAIRLSQICINGWDYSLDKENKEYGGIPWGPAYATKHTCSNAPIIAPLVEIYECLTELGDANASYYLDWAQKIYTYTKTNLLDTNKLYADLIGYQRKEKTTSNGMKKYVTTGLAGFDGTKYTYNTGAMISGAVALYRATDKPSYLMDAKNSANAAYSIFRMENGKIPYYPNHTETTWFNLVLLQGFLDLYEYDTKNGERYILSFQQSLDYAYDNHLKNGFLPRNYVEGWDDGNQFDTRKNVMDQASASQIYAMLALWAESRLEADNAKLEGIK